MEFMHVLLQRPERLECLGDAVVSAILTTYICVRYSDESEAFISRLRAMCPTLAPGIVGAVQIAGLGEQRRERRGTRGVMRYFSAGPLGTYT
jgi:hypothetical protein